MALPIAMYGTALRIDEVDEFDGGELGLLGQALACGHRIRNEPAQAQE
jgi:hypothetical protein